MKLKAIAATFKRGKFLRIYTMPNGEQWIGNGAALYKMSGMPQLTPPWFLKYLIFPKINKPIFVKSQNDIFAIDEKLVKPLYDDVDYLRFVKRTFGNGNEVAIACYNALELQAIIMPYKIGGDLVDEMKTITAYFSSYRYERFVKALSSKLNVDPETGEVLDGDSDELQEKSEEGAENGKDR